MDRPIRLIAIDGICDPLLQFVDPMIMCRSLPTSHRSAFLVSQLRRVDDHAGRSSPITTRNGCDRHSAAHPPSTGKSTPVNWRATSLARNKHALATSTSVLIRLSA